MSTVAIVASVAGGAALVSGRKPIVVTIAKALLILIALVYFGLSAWILTGNIDALLDTNWFCGSTISVCKMFDKY